MTRAGLGLAGTPATGKPAAQRTPSSKSLSTAPHLPATRTGSTLAPQWMPATPSPLLLAAAISPAMAVPCQELFSTSQPLYAAVRLSAKVTQSPGSLASASRPSPSLA